VGIVGLGSWAWEGGGAGCTLCVAHGMALGVWGNEQQVLRTAHGVAGYLSLRGRCMHCDRGLGVTHDM